MKILNSKSLLLLTHKGSGMSKPIESRIFIKKYSEFSALERNDIDKAILSEF